MNSLRFRPSALTPHATHCVGMLMITVVDAGKSGCRWRRQLCEKATTNNVLLRFDVHFESEFHSGLYPQEKKREKECFQQPLYNSLCHCDVTVVYPPGKVCACVSPFFLGLPSRGCDGPAPFSFSRRSSQRAPECWLLSQQTVQ